MRARVPGAAGRVQLRDAQGKLQAEGQETRYQQALVQWAEQQEEQERISTHFETQTFDMKARLEERMTRAEDIRKAFRVFQLEVRGWGRRGCCTLSRRPLCSYTVSLSSLSLLSTPSYVYRRATRRAG